MKVRKKIIIVMIPILLLSVILTNLTFGLFFRNYLSDQEKIRLNGIKENISANVASRLTKYAGTASDWGNWDDTYYFLEGANKSYIENNLMDDTFANLDVNFIIYINNQGDVIDKYYFDFKSNEKTEFPAVIFKNFDALLKFAELEDSAQGVLSLDNAYYFVASNDITDSVMQKEANGKMIIGRLLDEEILSEMETITGSEIVSVNTRERHSSDSIELTNISVNEKKDKLKFELILPNKFDQSLSIGMLMEMPRNLYITGMRHLGRFALINAAVNILLVFVVSLLLGVYISKPFINLLKDVEDIKISEERFTKLKEYGNDEFSFLRQSINSLLGIIEGDYSEKKERQKHIEYLSYCDQLTGLYNRRFFEEELERADMPENLPISFIYADVNGLKTINDAFGHHNGDLLLQKVANSFKEVSGSNAAVSRTGGDEFIILLKKTDKAAADILVKLLREKAEQEKIMGINISVSIGYATKTSEAMPVWEAMKSAEDSMYQSKLLTNIGMRSIVVKSIVNTLNMKYPLEKEHSERVSELCEDIGKACRLSDDDLKELKTAGKLHDIGKIALEDTILQKQAKLSEPEWIEVRGHPETGYRILSTSGEFIGIAEYVLAHHEKWDGTGYPKGLAGANIPFKARVITIADSYDAMTNKRPHNRALSKEEAASEIKANAGTQFDPSLARVFVEKILGEIW